MRNVETSFNATGIILNFTKNTSILFTSSKMRYELYTIVKFMHHNNNMLLMHNHYDNLFLQDVKDDVVYAVLGPFSSNQSQNLKTSILNFDENRVEYVKIKYNVTVPQNPVPVPSVEKPAKSDKGKFSSQTNIFPGFHKIKFYCGKH